MLTPPELLLLLLLLLLPPPLLPLLPLLLLLLLLPQPAATKATHPRIAPAVASFVRTILLLYVWFSPTAGVCVIPAS